MAPAEIGFKPHRHRGSREGWRSARRLTLDDVLLRVVDFGLAAVILAAPYFMGGRHPIGKFVYLLLTLIIAVAWLVRQAVGTNRGWLRSPAEWVVLSAVGLVVLQLIPLPPAVLAWLSPRQAQLLSLWRAPEQPGLGLGSWMTVSLSLGTTRVGLSSLVTYGLLFLVTAQRIESIDDVERLLKCVGLSAICMAVFGIVQYATSNGKFFWFYEHPDPFRTTSSEVVGSFINRNHFAHFLALGIAPLIWWTTVSLKARGRTGGTRSADAPADRGFGRPASVLGVGVVVVLLAGLMSMSRGGNAVIALALVTGCAVFWRASLLEIKALGGAVAVAAVVATALAVFGYSKVSSRLDDLASGSVEQLDPQGYRRGLWQANVKAIHDFPLCGAGVGTHLELYPIYFDNKSDLEFTHAESGYLQIGHEAGLAGLLLLAIALAMVVQWCIGGIIRAESKRALACLGAVSASLAASVMHSFVDFVWYIPACMSLTAILAAAALRLWHFTAAEVDDTRRRWAVPRVIWAAVAGLVAVVGAWSAVGEAGDAIAAPYWDDFLRASTAFMDIRNRPASAADPTAAAAKEVELDATNRRMIEALSSVVAWSPGNARAHLRLAGALLRSFEERQKSAVNAMALVQIRDAAFASRGTASPDKVKAWLARVLGDRRKLLDEALWHTRSALRLCPLQGIGYVYLAQLGFLDEGTGATKAACLDQALRLRPYDGDVLFALAQEALLSGDLKLALRYWRPCLRRGPEYRRQVVNLLAGRMPLEILLETLDLDRPAVEALYARLQELGLKQDRAKLRDYYLRILVPEAEQTGGPSGAALYVEAHRLLREAGNLPGAEEMIGRALTMAPDDFFVRYNAGLWCLETGNFAEAEKHLHWCSTRKPDDPQVQVNLRQAVTQGMQLSRQPVTSERKL